MNIPEEMEILMDRKKKSFIWCTGLFGRWSPFEWPAKWGKMREPRDFGYWGKTNKAVESKSGRMTKS